MKNSEENSGKTQIRTVEVHIVICIWEKMLEMRHAILNMKFKIASTKPIRIDFVDEAWLTPVSCSHEVRNRCGFLIICSKNYTICQGRGAEEREICPQRRKSLE